MAGFCEPLSILVTGVGGQGNVLASQVICLTAVEAGFLVASGEISGLAQRGGSVMSHVRIFQNRPYGPLIPRGRASVIVGFEPLETMRVLMEFGSRNTLVISNDCPSYPLGCLQGDEEYPGLEKIQAAINRIVEKSYFLPAAELAREAGSPLAANMVMTGALAGSGLLPFEPEFFQKVIADLFQGSTRDINLRAFFLGFQQIN